MTFEQSIRTCFAKFADFQGEASRSEYWWFIAFVVGGGFAMALLSRPMGGLFGLVTLVPSLAAGARRLHDTNRSAWWLWLVVLGPIGLVVLAFFMVQEGEVRDGAVA
jgi:uncharacterized membrane protein YhaH (DUF805 family)